MRISILLLCLSGVSCRDSSPPIGKTEMRQFLMSAVRDGLAADGADPKLVLSLIRPDETKWENFVYKCGICLWVSEGFEEYARESAQPGWTRSGSGFPPELEGPLKSADRKERLGALETLVRRYVSRALDRSTLTHRQKKELSTLLEEEKKFSMDVIMKSVHFGSESCPSCAGAARASLK